MPRKKTKTVEDTVEINTTDIESVDVESTAKAVEYKLVAALPRLGSTHVEVPGVGTVMVSKEGQWEEESLANKLLDQTKEIYCTRKQAVITVKPVYEMRATQAQLDAKPG